MLSRSQTPPLFTGRQLFTLIWPLVVEQLLNVFVGMVDVVMVASIGEAAVSGVSLVDSMNQLLIYFLAALTVGGTVVCSQFIGKGEPEQARQSGAQLLLLTVSATLAVSILLLIGNRWLLALVYGRIEEAVMDNALLYYRITVCSFPFLALYNSCAALFRAMGNSRISMKTSLLMNAMNIAGNALCIYGLRMGVSGVAIPTLLSRIFAAVLLFSLLQKKDSPLRISRLHSLKPDRAIMGRILSIGIPGSVEGTLFQLGKLLLQSLVATLGTAAIAGYAVACNLVQFQYLPGKSLGMALTAVAGRCVGAREAEQAERYTKLFMLLNYGLLAILATSMLLGRYFLVGIYNLSPEATEIAARMLLFHCFAMVIWPPAFLPPYSLQAANDAKFTMYVSVGCMFLFRVALAYLFVGGMGLDIQYVWVAMYIDWIFRLIIYSFRLRGFADRIRRIPELKAKG